MSIKGNPLDLYSKHVGLYQKLFIDILQYQKGIEAYFRSSPFIKPDYRVLDAGTGTGTLIKALYNVLPKDDFAKIRFTGFDLSPAMLERFKSWIQENQIHNITVQLENVLSFKGANFDCVITASMLEYVPKESFITALKNLHSSLKKDGKILVIISKKTRFNYFLIWLWWKAHIFSREELVSAFKETGFTDITFTLFPGKYSYLNRWGFIIEARKS